MATGTPVDEEVKNAEIEATDENTNETPRDSPKPMAPISEIAIEASQIVSRLEKFAEGTAVSESDYPQSPVLLGPDQKTDSDILNSLDALVYNSGEDVENGTDYSLDDVAKYTIISHSIAAYVGSFEKSRLQKLSMRLTADTNRWISQLFGFLDSACFYHDDHLEGLVRITRMMLHYKYPRYLEDGALAYSSAPPTIYSSVASPLGVVQHICRQLGLPMSCIRPVPVNQTFDSLYTINVAALQKMLAEDKISGRTPLVVIADAATPLTGQADSLVRIRELCKTHEVWLHLRGHNLAAMVLPSLQHSVQSVPVADSLTLPVGLWLRVPGLPLVTIYKLWDSGASLNNHIRYRQVGVTRESTLPVIAGLSTDHLQRRVICLPLWTCLQSLGREGVHNRIRSAFVSCERMHRVVDAYRQIRVLAMLEFAVSVVVFQFIPDTEEGEELGRIPQYYDKLNSWLGQILQLDAPQVPLEICELENYGLAIRYCPFENLHKQPTVEEFDMFVQCLEQQLMILRATVQQKEIFIKLVEASPVLKLVDMPDWAGLGGVRYVPEVWEQLLTDQVKEELNSLNISLVKALRASDAAFSLGEGPDGLVCVRFGMLTSQSDVEELVSLVIRVGKSVEENSRVLESMTEIVIKGIETATLDLQKENEERIWQEGLLRHVPVVGSFVNWWSPKTNETGVRGRSLNLTQGVVESTENIYRYHMQIPAGSAPAGVTKSPPTPLIQTPVGGSHSRSGSQASSQGAPPTPQSPQGQDVSVRVAD